MRTTWFARAACGWALGAAAVAAMVPLVPAVAEVTRVVVSDSGPIGMFGGREYTWVAAHMEGTVARDDGTTGHYRVPISLNYPGRDSNGFGFVDVLNIAEFTVWADDAPLGRPTAIDTGNELFSDSLRREGFTYVSVQWSRLATEVLGPDYGLIENGVDGYEIIRDAVRLLRNPETLEGQLALAPPAADWVVGHGHSSSGGLLRGMLLLNENRDESGAPVFDGLLLTATNGETCTTLNNDDTPRAEPGRLPIPNYFAGGVPCTELPEDGKLITIRTQTEQERVEHQLHRDDTAAHRMYEVAGVAHIPEPERGLRFAGAARQNPATWEPVARAMLRHLVDWIVAGKAPPPALYLEGTVDGGGVYRLSTDNDGNVLGGIRLPHMATVLPNGERAGAPLGVYGGLDRTLGPALGFVWLGGTFEPFSAEELARRYPTREAYVDLVRRAAAALLADGYILPEAYDAYVRAADRQRLAPIPIDPAAIIEGVDATLQAVGQ